MIRGLIAMRIRRTVEPSPFLLLVAAIICLHVFHPLHLFQQANAQDAANKDSQSVSEQDIQLLRQDIRSQKKQLIASNLRLTDAEATKFWPVYDQYNVEMTNIGDQKYALIKEY